MKQLRIWAMLLVCLLCGGRAGAQFVSDTFAGTSGTNLEAHTADSGATWTKHSMSGSGMTLSTTAGNLTHAANGSIACYYVSATSATTEYDVQATYQNGTYTNIATHIDPATQSCYLGGWNGSNWVISKFTAGSLTFPATGATSPAAASGQVGRFTTRLSGSNLVITLYVNGASVVSYTDTSPLASGRAGVYAYGAGEAFSAFSASNPSGSLAAGTLSVASNNPASVSLALTAATGGTSPYTYQLQRAPDSSGAAGTYANVGSALTGQTGSATLTDSTVSASTKYWWRIVVTDSASNSVNSNAVTATTPSLSATSFIVFGVDSLTYGVNASSGQGTTSGTVYPADLLSYLGSGWAGTNLGIAGQAVSATSLSSYTSLYNASYARNIACVWGGTNDIRPSGGNENDTQTYNVIKSFCLSLRAAGFKVVVSTITTFGNNVNFTTTSETYRLSVNTQIRNNWRQFADALADLASDTRLGLSTSGANTTYFASDQVHMTDAGYSIAASYFANSIASLVSPGGVIAGVSRRFVH